MTIIHTFIDACGGVEMASIVTLTGLVGIVLMAFLLLADAAYRRGSK